MVDGRKEQTFFPQYTWGMFYIQDGAPHLALSEGRLPNGVTQAIECKPRLVVNGVLQTFKPQPSAARSAVGLDADGRLLLAATKGFLTLEQWAACLRDGLGCVDALNLDGGPSTQLTVHGDVPLYLPGGWKVPVLLTVAPAGE